MKTFLFALVMGVAMASAVGAQQPPSTNTSPAIVLPRELELEEQLQRARDERDAYRSRLEAAELDKQQMTAVINHFLSEALKAVQQPRLEQAAEAREAVGRKLVAAMGGDWEKRDRWDWERRGLLKPDGTFVPLVKPETKKPEGPQ